jgi:hypothetical protein
MILAGGAGRNEVRVFGGSEPHTLIGSVLELDRAVLCVDWANKSDLFAFGSSEGWIHIMSALSDSTS